MQFPLGYPATPLKPSIGNCAYGELLYFNTDTIIGMSYSNSGNNV